MSETIEFTNGSFELFINPEIGKSINKFRECLYGKPALDFEIFIEKIIGSAEFKGYLKQKEKLIKLSQDKYKKVNLLIKEIDGLIDLMNSLSELKLDKITINMDYINIYKDPNKDLNGKDFSILKQFVIFE